MPSVFSKIDSLYGKKLLDYLASTPKQKILTGSVIFIVLFLVHLRLQKGEDIKSKIDPFRQKKQKHRGSVNIAFIKRLLELLKIAFPTWKSSEVFYLFALTVFLALRTFLSIYISTVNGRVVKAIIRTDRNMFFARVLNLALCAVPASFVNSYLEFLNKRIAINVRKNLTIHFNNKYLKDMIYYQVTNIDSRISNPDQRLTQDIEKWSNSLSNLYSNLTKPLLDIILFSQKLAAILGWRGPIYEVIWYFISIVILRFISPAFGKLTAMEQQLEGEFRACHTELVHHSEEIAFYKGQIWEKARVNETFKRLTSHSRGIILRRLYMGCFDSMLTKYGAVLVGYSILGLPIFGPGRSEYLAKIGSDPSVITKDYVRNSSLLINLAKSIGRLVISYKEIQNLAGYTSLIHELNKVLGDLENGVYVKRKIVDPYNLELPQLRKKTSFMEINQGQVIESNEIKFEGVPIYAPNGELLINPITFELKPGMHCIISGPNGCGKTSLVRVLGSLWPVFTGTLYRPSIQNMFYIPQRPYLPPGTLRDQVIYPHSKLQMFRKRVTDEDIRALLKAAHLDYLIDREGGLDAINDWNDVLSGGEKQRIAMSRLFYHKPTFAILDECTSAVSIDVEASLYIHCKELGITLLTVSLRQSLIRFHDYQFSLDGEGGWGFDKIQNEQDQ